MNKICTIEWADPSGSAHFSCSVFFTCVPEFFYKSVCCLSCLSRIRFQHVIRMIKSFIHINLGIYSRCPKISCIVQRLSVERLNVSHKCIAGRQPSVILPSGRRSISLISISFPGQHFFPAHSDSHCSVSFTPINNLILQYSGCEIQQLLFSFAASSGLAAHQ